MSRDFIELYDDDGYRYIVNMDKISFVNVAGRIEMYSWMWDEESVVCEQLGLAEVKAEKGGDE